MEIFTGKINLKRLNSNIIDAVAIAESINIDRQPIRSCRLEVTVDGASYAVGGGTITIDAEDFLFSEDTVKVGTVDHTTIAGSVVVDGISAGFISVRALSKTGQPLNQEVTVEENMPIRFYAQSGKIRMLRQGQQKIAEYKLMANYDKDVRENDIIYPVSGIYGIDKGQITFVRHLMDFDGATLHIEAEIMKL